MTLEIEGKTRYIKLRGHDRGLTPSVVIGSAAVSAVTDPLIEDGAGSEDRTQVSVM